MIDKSSSITNGHVGGSPWSRGGLRRASGFRVLLLWLLIVAGGVDAAMVYSEDFEDGEGGYTVSGANPSWAWGMVGSGPGAAHSGINAWGTNLDGDYPHDGDAYLASPTIDLSGHSSEAFILSWWQFLVTEPGFDIATAEASANGGATWTAVYGRESGAVDQRWARHSAYLPSRFAVPNFRIRFRLLSDEDVSLSGYYVDDVSILTTEEEQLYAESFDLTDGGFAVTGTASWEHGSPIETVGVAHSAPHAWGTDLDGHYAAGETGFLTSPAIDASASAGRALFVSWWQVLVSEEGRDIAGVDVSTDGGDTWSSVYESSGIVSASWTQRGVILAPEYSVSGLRLRFYLHSDSSIGNVGFYLDDLLITAAAQGRPEALDVSKVGQEDLVVTFDRADFAGQFLDGWGAGLATVRIASLPERGTVTLAGEPVSAGQEIPAPDIGGLRYAPDPQFNGSDSFSWNGSNGVLYGAALALVELAIAAVNDPPEIITFSVADPTQTVPGYTDQRDVAVSVEGTGVDDDIMAWLVTEAADPPLPDDTRWSSEAPLSHAIVAPEGAVHLYAWCRDSGGLVSGLTAASQVDLILELPVVFRLFVDGASPGELQFGHWGQATSGVDPNLDLSTTEPSGDSGTVCLEAPGGGAPFLRADFRPPETVTRWRLRTDAAEDEEVVLTWDVSAIHGGRTLYLQLLTGERPVGRTVDMQLQTSITLTGTTTAELVYGEGGTTDINLSTGWNLIGTPLLTTQSFDDLLRGRGRHSRAGIAAWSWDGERYLPALWTDPPQAEVGYWFHTASEHASATVLGLPADGQIMLHQGWNLITPVHVVDGLASETTIASMWTWAAAQRGYVSVSGGVLRPGQAYWLFALEAGPLVGQGGESR